MKIKTPIGREDRGVSRGGSPPRARARPADDRSDRPNRPAKGTVDVRRSRVGFAVEINVFWSERGRARGKRITLSATTTVRTTGPARRLRPSRQAELAAKLEHAVSRDALSRLLAAMGHRQRLTILLKLLGGEATHRLLAKATGLKPGPLYYHLRELREFGLIGPRVRDLYTITPCGQQALLVALACGRLCGVGGVGAKSIAIR